MERSEGRKKGSRATTKRRYNDAKERAQSRDRRREVKEARERPVAFARGRRGRSTRGEKRRPVEVRPRKWGLGPHLGGQSDSTLFVLARHRTRHPRQEVHRCAITVRRTHFVCTERRAHRCRRFLHAARAFALFWYEIIVIRCVCVFFFLSVIFILYNRDMRIVSSILCIN